MILSALRKSLLEKARAWAKAEGLPLPENLTLGAPPAHVAADISLPWPMAVAKAARKNPLEIARSLAKSFEGVLEIESVYACAPGFVNIKLTDSALRANLKAITLTPETYGHDEAAGSTPSVLIEFVSANPTGPLHFGHARGAAFGDSLVRILRRLGRKVEAESYINDAGRQIELLGLSLMARYQERLGQPAQIPEGGYHGNYLKAIAAEIKNGEKWKADDFNNFAMDRILKEQQRDLQTFRVHFDHWYHETGLHGSGAVQKVLERLKEYDMAYEKDGAIWLGTASQEGDDKDRVLVRSDGRPTYFLPDIAYHLTKIERGYGLIIDIWGADHHGYVPRMTAAMAALGHPPQQYKALIYQLVHLFRGEETVRMSKRSGDIVELREVADEVGVDACRFFFALRTPNSHMNFDLELAKKQSSENPVFYCQYVHARIGSIFKEAAKQGILGTDEPLPGPNARFLNSPEEKALMVKMAWFPELLKSCEKELSPHPLANYIMELAGLFHPFYEKCRVVDPANAEVSRARLLLCTGVRDVIREGLGLLGVSAPEQM